MHTARFDEEAAATTHAKKSTSMTSIVRHIPPGVVQQALHGLQCNAVTGIRYRADHGSVHVETHGVIQHLRKR